VLVVIASSTDARAADFVDKERARGARLLTCRDLSRPGWVFDPGQPETGQVVVEDRAYSVKEIERVLTLLPAVGVGELEHIVPDDREYIAAEMMAFLLAWLSAPPLPVFNRPSPFCLTGPQLRPEQWVRLAHQLGQPVQERTRSLTPAVTSGFRPTWLLEPDDPHSWEVPVIDGSPVRPADATRVCEEADRMAARLAIEAGARLFTARFVGTADSPRFQAGWASLDVSEPATAGRLSGVLRATG
jgi:hypothetical protein